MYHNCGFLSKFVTVDGKYLKCQKNIHFCLINPIPGSPGPISRESRNGKIVGIPGNREREIPGMKHLVQYGLLHAARQGVFTCLAGEEYFISMGRVAQVEISYQNYCHEMEPKWLNLESLTKFST
jgi:hypothetical protein